MAGEARPRQKPVSLARRRIGWLILLAATLGGGLAGLAAARFLFPAGGFPEAGQRTAWQHQLPDIPAHVSADYRALLEETGEAVSDVMEAHPDSPSAVAALALLHYLAHDRLGEMDCWQRCLELDPTEWLAYSRLVDLMQQGGDYERIVKLMREALAVDPANATYCGILGSALMHLNRYGEAREILESHHRVAAGNAETYLVLGKVYSQMDRLEEAKQSLLRATALAPRRVDVLYSLAAVCAKLGEAEQAAEFRRQFERLKTQQLQSESRMGVREEMRDDLYVPARVAEILTYAARAYLRHGDAERAETCLRKAADVSPADVECRRVLSELCGREGQLEEALRWVRELRKIDPDNVLHYRNEGILYGRLNRFDEAEQVFRDICRVAPERGFGYAALAELYLRTGRNLAEAKSLAERAVELEPTASSCSVLAALAEQAGDLDQARAALEQAMTLDPDNAKYQRMYESIFPPE